MRIGFTGTREKLTGEQWEVLKHKIGLLTAKGAYALHHGDCVGADAAAHDLAKRNGLHVVVHPPIRDVLRAFKTPDEERVAKAYFPRNRDIVDESDILIGCPKDRDQRYSGTWYTINYGIKRRRRVTIIHSEGQIEEI